MTLDVKDAVVINLPERRSRLNRFYAGTPVQSPFPKPRRHPGVQEAAPPWYASSDRAWGCRTAHLQILQHAWQEGVETTMVFEDDAMFVNDFAVRWHQMCPVLPKGWDMIMLGGQHRKVPIMVNRHVVRCVDTQRTHAYVIRLKAIPLLMRIWGCTSRHIDHASTKFQDQAKVYAPIPFMVGQREGFSDISLKENPTRFWDTW